MTVAALQRCFLCVFYFPSAPSCLCDPLKLNENNKKPSHQSPCIANLLTKNDFCHLFDLKSICYSGQMASSTAVSDCCWNDLSLSSVPVSMCSSMNATAGRVVLISWLPISSKYMSYMWRYTKEQRNNNPKSQYNKRKCSNPAIQQSASDMKGLFSPSVAFTQPCLIYKKKSKSINHLIKSATGFSVVDPCKYP